jgi:hypothetical protein
MSTTGGRKLKSRSGDTACCSVQQQQQKECSKNTTAASTAAAAFFLTIEIAPVSSPLTIAAISSTPETAAIS